MTAARCVATHSAVHLSFLIVPVWITVYLQHAEQHTPAAEAEAEAELEPLITVFAFEGSKRVPTPADLATPQHAHSPRGSGLPMGSETEPTQQGGQPVYDSSQPQVHIGLAYL